MKISQKWGARIERFYDQTLCNEAAVHRQAAASRPPVPAGDKQISVAIAHYNRGNRIHLPLRNVIAEPRVSEIVIQDDASHEREYEALCRNVERLDIHGKIRIVRNDQNLGALRTKFAAVRETKGEWVILLDSDNTVFQSYLNTVFGLETWNSAVTYCPGWAFPYFSFRSLAGDEIDFQRACELSRERIFHRVFLMNDGNYFFNREAYLRELEPLLAVRNDVADVIVANYLWLSRGNRLQVLKEASYCHRIDPSSFWMRTYEDSRKRLMSIYERLDAGLRWDESFSVRLAEGVVR